MSSSPAFYYTCSPKPSSAFATSAFSPTGGGPLSCHFAGKPSQRFSRKPNHKPPPPRKPDRFGSVPSVAGRWWPSRDLRPPNSNSARPLPLRSRRMKLQLQAPHSVPLTTRRRCVPFLPLNQLSVPNPGSTSALLPHANYHPTNPGLALAGSSSCSPSFSHNPNTIEYP